MAPLRRQLAWLRVSAASLALFLLIGAGHVLPALHFALVVHRVCAEHGELMHEPARLSEPARTLGEDAGAPALHAGAGGHEHEHCSIPALPGVNAVLAGAPSVAGEQLASAAPLAGSERAAHVCIALLAYAPKLAPPAVGA